MSAVEEATRIYWVISQQFHRGTGEAGSPLLTTSQAIHWSQDTAFSVGSHRRVQHKLLSLEDAIIKGRGRKKKNMPLNNLLQLRKATVQS
jgi:hypothetical protein